MKHFILILGLIVGSVATANAQYAKTGEMKSRGSKIIVDGEKLTSQQAAKLFSDFAGEEMGVAYLKNRKAYRTGVTLSIVGPVAFGVGSVAYVVGALMTLDSNLLPFSEIVHYTGATMATGGVLMTVAGIPTAAVYRHRIKKATAEYNSAVASKPIVTISPARSGIGIAMNF